MKITLKPSDSLFNTGLIGFYNILKFNKENVHQNIPTYIPEKYNVIKGTKYRLPKDYIIIENIIKKKNVKFRKFNFISCYYANNFYTDTFVDEDNYNLFLA